VLIPRHLEVYGRVNSEARKGMELQKKDVFCNKILPQKTELKACFHPRNASEWNSESLLLFLFHGTEFQVVFSSASIFVSRNIIPSCFLLGGMVSNGIRRVCFYRIASIYGSEQNSKSFLSRGTTGIPAGESNCSVYSVFSRIIFCRKLPILMASLRSLLKLSPAKSRA
jgi:hypothetical protein